MPNCLLRLRHLLTGVFLFSLALAPALSAATSFRYVGRGGFTDPKHTRDDGYQFSELIGMAGVFPVGISERFYGTPDPQSGELPDRSAWMAGSTLGGSHSIGLYDAVHTSATGYHTTDIVIASPQAGYAGGHSIRYNGLAVERGQSAWIASWFGGTHRAGLFYDDPTPPLADGTVSNFLVDVVGSGRSIGYALVEDGQSAWRGRHDYNTASYISTRIGFYDAAHTTPGAAPHNTPIAITRDGLVIGHTRFSDSQIAWLEGEGDTTPTQIGLYDAGHTLPDGTHFNTALAINEAGAVIGTALRRDPAFDDVHYAQAWARKPSGEIVLIDSNPNRSGEPLFLTESNWVGGNSTGNSPASTAWISHIASGALTPVGLGFDWDVVPGNRIMYLAENGVAAGRTNGFRTQWAWLTDASGVSHAIGFGGLSDNGVSQTEITGFAPDGVTVGQTTNSAFNFVSTGWIASPVTGKTYRIGLYDAVHTGAPSGTVPGEQQTYVTHVTSSTWRPEHFAAGYSIRYHGDDTTEGQTAWIYNSPKKAYAKVELSVRASDGYAYSRVNYLSEAGVAVGTYKKFAPDGTELGDRAFVWITGRGVFDLADRLNVDPADVNWAYFTDAIITSENSGELIVGHGVPLDSLDSQGIYSAQIKYW